MKEAENGHKSRHQPMYQVHNNSSSFYQTENRDERNTLNLYALTRACRQHLYLATRETSIWKVQSQIQYNLVMSSQDCDEFARLSVSHAGIELLSPITFGQNYEHCYGCSGGTSLVQRGEYSNDGTTNSARSMSIPEIWSCFIDWSFRISEIVIVQMSSYRNQLKEDHPTNYIAWSITEVFRENTRKSNWQHSQNSTISIKENPSSSF